MAYGIVWKILLLILSLYFGSSLDDKVCTKQIIHRYKIYKVNEFTMKLDPEEKFNKNVIFVCCKGFRETSRNRIQPNCEPICKQQCGHGYCYSPSKCACYYGYELSDLGVCKRKEEFKPSTKRITQKLNVGLEIEWRNKKTEQKRFRVESSTARITTTQIDDDIHIIKFTPSGISNFETNIAQHERIKVKSSTNWIDANPSSSTQHEEMKIESRTLRIKAKLSPDTNYMTIGRKLDPNSDRVQYFTETLENHTHKLENSQLSGNNFTWKRTNYSGGSIDTTPSHEVVTSESKYRPTCVFGVCTCQNGYQLFHKTFCQPCPMRSQCHCKDGYAYDSTAIQCKPLCDGLFDGCIQGTCIGFDQCRCNSGAKQINQFRCFVEEATKVSQQNIGDKRWYFMLLLIPAAILVLSFCIVIKRSRSAKSNRVKTQKRGFQEIRFINSSNEPFLERQSNQTIGNVMDEPCFEGNQYRNTGNVVVITI